MNPLIRCWEAMQNDNNRLKVNWIRLEIGLHPISIWEFPPSPSLKAGAGWAELAAGSDPYLVSWWKFRSPKFAGLIVRSYDQCWNFYNSLFLQVRIGYRVFLIERMNWIPRWLVCWWVDWWCSCVGMASPRCTHGLNSNVAELQRVRRNLPRNPFLPWEFPFFWLRFFYHCCHPMVLPMPGYRDIIFYWKYFLCTDLRVFPKVNDSWQASVKEMWREVQGLCFPA